MNQENNERAETVLTIGHSNHPLEHFLSLLHQNCIEELIDTRSSPRSRYAIQFDLETLQSAVRAAGIQYLYLGRELGGRPKEERFYDAEGYVRYDLLAIHPPFVRALEVVKEEAVNNRIALLCSEENPYGCHRRLLISRALIKQGFGILHIRGDGRLQTEEELKTEVTGGQASLFSSEEMEEQTAWRSIQSVLPTKAQNSSLRPSKKME